MSLPPFEAVVADHGAVVLRVCRAILGPIDAEDAWSDTFLAALRAYPRLRRDTDTAGLRGWLVTIAHRKAIDGYRQRQRAAVPVDELPHTRKSAAVDQVSERMPDPALQRAVRALPAKQRQVVAYRYLADLSYSAIAAIVGGTETAARRSAADGIATLRHTYRPEDQS